MDNRERKPDHLAVVFDDRRGATREMKFSSEQSAP
jgi:hypothetical protein